MQRTVPAPEFLPDGTGHGHVEQAGKMVRMIVREENPVDMPDAKAKLRKPDHGATATVDENAFLTGLNQCRGAKCIDLCIGYSGAEKCHTKNVVGRWKPRHDQPLILSALPQKHDTFQVTRLKTEGVAAERLCGNRAW